MSRCRPCGPAAAATDRVSNARATTSSPQVPAGCTTSTASPSTGRCQPNRLTPASWGHPTGLPALAAACAHVLASAAPRSWSLVPN